MRRLTEKENDNDYIIQGKNLDYHCVSKDKQGYVTYRGEHINKLAEYENLGTIDGLKILLNKNMPKNPIRPDDKRNYYGCPICKHIVNSVQWYCEFCGQKLNWTFEDYMKSTN